MVTHNLGLKTWGEYIYIYIFGLFINENLLNESDIDVFVFALSGSNTNRIWMLRWIVDSPIYNASYAIHV